MSLRDTARIGRDIYWTRRGIDEFGGGFLGLFLLKITELWEKCQNKASDKAKALDKQDKTT